MADARASPSFERSSVAGARRGVLVECKHHFARRRRCALAGGECRLPNQCAHRTQKHCSSGEHESASLHTGGSKRTRPTFTLKKDPAYFASGSGRSWKCTALLVVPFPPS